MSNGHNRKRGEPLTPAAKVHENVLRRIADRRGMRLERCRRRDPLAVGYGLYRLVDANTPSGGGGPYDMTLDEVARELGEDDRVTAAA